jgi:hypothetical protein
MGKPRSLRTSLPIRRKSFGKRKNFEKKAAQALKIHCGFIALGNDMGEQLSRKWKEEVLSLDELSRGLANDTITRRRALAVLAATAVGALIPFARVEAQPGCRHRGHPCEGDQDCCGDLVCRGNPDRRCRRPRNGGGDNGGGDD